MNEFTRLKPLCLIIISGLHVDDLLSVKNFQELIIDYPFLTLSSDKNNVFNFSNSYIELGNGNKLKDINEKNNISLSRVLSDVGLRQLHVADLDSYAYATYFFNNRNKTKHEQEEWFKIRSMKCDFNSKSSESTHNKGTRTLIKEINKQYYDFIFVNYNDLLINSNKSRVLKEIDKNIKNIIDLVLSFNGLVLISSNSSLVAQDNRVPLFLIGKIWQGKSFIDYDYEKNFNQQNINGDISQIAPTILKILGLLKPRGMKEKSLI